MERRTESDDKGVMDLPVINPGVFINTHDAPTCPILFINGHIYLDANTKVQNLLVQNGVVVAVNVPLSRHTNAKVVDLQSSALYPGFCDSHTHLVETSLLMSGADLREKKDPEAIIQAVAESLPDPPTLQPYFCAGFSLENYDSWSLDDLRKLDKVTGDQMVMLSDCLGHNMIVNSAAINTAEITPETPVPPGGKVILQNDEEGRPRLTGMLREEAMLLAGKKLLPMFTDEMLVAGTTFLMQQWASIGYTSIVDLMGAPVGSISHPDMCRTMELEGVLPLRVNFNYTFFDMSDIQGGCGEIGKDTDLVRFIGNKLFIDGAYAGGEAWTSWEHADGGYGLHTVFSDGNDDHDNYNIYRIIACLEELGLNCHYHIQGDVALDLTLDALSAAAGDKGLKCVHTLIHLAYPRADQIERIAGFNGKVVTTVQPGFWDVEEGLERYYGDRTNASYPVKDLFDGGLSVGMSTDCFVSPMDLAPPTAIMGIAMNEKYYRTPLTMQELITGFTQGSAATTGKSDFGTLFPGSKADMVVYEKDLYSVDPSEFSKTYPRVLSTWVSGKQVFEAIEATSEK